MKIQKPLTVSAPGGAETVLLHTCCAPCSSAIIECLMRSGIRPTIYYCNPNIYPVEEYLIRKDECTRYASALGLDIVDADYDHSDWLQWVRAEAAADGCGTIETERERGGRCLECFKYRLLKSAEYALEHEFRVLTTTLASSRWKSLEQIDKAGIDLRYEKVPAAFMPPFVGIGADRNRLRPRLVITADSPIVVKRTHGIGKYIRHRGHPAPAASAGWLHRRRSRPTVDR